jgi:hypothetical protein
VLLEKVASPEKIDAGQFVWTDGSDNIGSLAVATGKKRA